MGEVLETIWCHLLTSIQIFGEDNHILSGWGSIKI